MKDIGKRKYYKSIWFWIVGFFAIAGLLFGNIYQPGKLAEEMTSAVMANLPEENSIKEGSYKVGTDIKAGEYVLVSNGGAVSTTGGDYIKIIRIENRVIISVTKGQMLKFDNATMYPIDSAPKAVTVEGKIPAGAYKIGVDLPAGSYTFRSYDNKNSCRILSFNKNPTYISQDQYFNYFIPDSSEYNFLGERNIPLTAGTYILVSNGYIVTK